MTRGFLSKTKNPRLRPNGTSAFAGASASALRAAADRSAPACRSASEGRDESSGRPTDSPRSLFDRGFSREPNPRLPSRNNVGGQASTHRSTSSKSAQGSVLSELQCYSAGESKDRRRNGIFIDEPARPDFVGARPCGSLRPGGPARHSETEMVRRGFFFKGSSKPIADDTRQTAMTLQTYLSRIAFFVSTNSPACRQ